MNSILRRSLLLSAFSILLPLQAFGLEMQTYAGGGVGLFNYDKINDSVFGLYVSGGAKFPETKYFGAEARLGTAFEAEKAGFGGGGPTLDRYDLDYFLSALGRAEYPVLPEVNVYGLLGLTVASWSYDHIGVTSYSNSGTDVDISMGFGVDYRLRSEWLVGLEWMRYSSDVMGLVGTVRYEY